MMNCPTRAKRHERRGNMFVYVMDLDSAKLLEERGFKLIRKDARNGVFIFENKDGDAMNFTLDIPCSISDVLSF